MVCLLCLESVGDPIPLTSDEAVKCIMPKIIFNHFHTLFMDKPLMGEVCRQCWCSIDIFQCFYDHIERVHLAANAALNVSTSFAHVDTVDYDDNDDVKHDIDQLGDVFEDCIAFGLDVGPTTKNEGGCSRAEIDVKQPLVKVDSTFDDDRFDDAADYAADDYTRLSSDSADDDKANISVSCPPANKIKYKQKPDFSVPECDICKKTFKRLNTLRNHIYNMHVQKDVQCTLCSKTFTTDTTLRRHMLIMHNPDRKPRVYKRKQFKTFKCEFCGEYFLSEYHMEKHIKRKHIVLPFKCTHKQCVESFASAAELDAHGSTVHEKAPCPECGKIVVKKSLEIHISRMHKNRTETVCELCGKVFALDYLKRTHMPSEHGNLEKVQCDMCKDWFKDKGNLLKHMKVIHLGAPKTCHVCGKIAPNIKALQSHLLIHEAPKYICIICGKGFRHSGKLRDHSSIHTGKNDAYECTFCGRKFRYSSSWSAHRMKFHPELMADAIKRMERIKDKNTRIKTSSTSL